jgi:hypothetical protein
MRTDDPAQIVQYFKKQDSLPSVVERLLLLLSVICTPQQLSSTAVSIVAQALLLSSSLTQADKHPLDHNTDRSSLPPVECSNAIYDSDVRILT